MPPFSQDGVIFALLGVTDETIEILQPLINFFDRTKQVTLCI